LSVDDAGNLRAKPNTLHGTWPIDLVLCASALTRDLLLSLYRYSQCLNLRPDALRPGRLKDAKSNLSRRSAGFGHCESKEVNGGSKRDSCNENDGNPYNIHFSGVFSRIVCDGEIAFNLGPGRWTLLSIELSRSVTSLFKVTYFGGKLRRVQASV
jgi:hypothetical protein